MKYLKGVFEMKKRILPGILLLPRNLQIGPLRRNRQNQVFKRLAIWLTPGMTCIKAMKR
jgi:hypothetical protein